MYHAEQPTADAGEPTDSSMPTDAAADADQTLSEDQTPMDEQKIQQMRTICLTHQAQMEGQEIQREQQQLADQILNALPAPPPPPQTPTEDQKGDICQVYPCSFFVFP